MKRIRQSKRGQLGVLNSLFVTVLMICMLLGGGQAWADGGQSINQATNLNTTSTPGRDTGKFSNSIQNDYYSYTVNAAGTMVIDVVNTGGKQIDYVITIKDSLGNNLFPPFDAQLATGQESATFNIPLPNISRTYYILLNQGTTSQSGGTTNYTVTASFIDNVAPPVSLETPTNGQILPTATPVISGTVEAGSTVKVYVDGVLNQTITNAPASWSCSPALGQGSHTVYATATDAANNTSNPTPTVNFKVDTVNPGITFTPNGNLTYAKSQSVKIDVSDAVSGVDSASLYYIWDMNLLAPVFTFSWTPFANGATLTHDAGDGTYYLHVRALDGLGHESIATSQGFNMDNTVPSLTVQAIPTLANSDVIVKVTPSEALAANPSVVSGIANPVSFNFDHFNATEGAFGTYYYIANVRFSQFGAVQVMVSGGDAAGNVGNYNNNSLFVIDNTKPIITLTSPQAGAIFNSPDKSFMVEGSVSDLSTPNAGDITLYIDGQAYPLTSNNFSIRFTKTDTDGNKTLKVYAVDKANNIGDEVSVNYTIDTAAPVLSVSTPAANQVFNTRSIPIKGSSNDVTLQTITVNGTPIINNFAGGNITSSFNVGADGSHTITVTARDSAGHSTNSANIPIFVDTQKPVVTISAPAANEFKNTSIVTVEGQIDDHYVDAGHPLKEVKITSSDNNSVLAEEVWAENGVYKFRGQISLTDGSKTIYVTAKDTVDNASDIAQVGVRVDTVGPSISASHSASSGFVKAGDTVTFTVTSSENLVPVPSIKLKYADNTEATVANVKFTGTASNYTWQGSAVMPADAVKSGNVAVSINGTDEFGNPGQAVTSFILDTKEANLTAITTPEITAGTWYSLNSILVSGTVDDDYLKEVRVNGVQATTQNGGFSYNITGLTSGTKSINVRAEDKSGNVKLITFTLNNDLDAPALSANLPAENSIKNSKIINVTGTVSDIHSGLASLAITTSEGENITPNINGNNYSADVSFSSDGKDKSITITATDKAGHTTVRKVARFEIDTTKPEIVISYPQNGAMINKNKVTVVCGVNDASPLKSVTINNVAAVSDGNGNYSAQIPLHEGANNIQIVAVDQVDNTTTTATAEFPYFIDVSYAFPTLTIAANPDLTSFGEVEISVASDKALAAAPTLTVTTSRNLPEVLTSYSSLNNTYYYKYSVQPGDNGTAAISANAVDLYGNEAEISAESETTFTVDLTAPVLTDVTPANGLFTKLPSITVTGTATDLNGIKNIEIKDVNGESKSATPDAAGKFTATLNGLANGTHTIEIKATDNANNVSTVISRSITVDLDKPNIEITFPLAGQIMNSAAAVTLQGTLTDATSAASLKVNGISVSTSGGIIDYLLPGTTEGSNTYHLEAVDQAGNITTKDITFIIDTQKPILNVTSPADGTKWGKNGVTVAGSANDSATSSLMTVTVNGTPIRTGAGAFSYALTGLSNGTNTITIVATDGAGHTTSVTRTVEVNNNDPVLFVTASPSLISTGQVLFTLESDKQLNSINSTIRMSNGITDGLSFSYSQMQNEKYIYTASKFINNTYADGTAVISVSGTDAYSNWKTGTTALAIDNSKPVITGVLPNGTQTVRSGELAIEVTATDAASGIERVTINGEVATLSNGKYVKEYIFNESGEKTFTILAYDHAGNISDTFTRKINVDVGGPIFTIDCQPDKLNNTDKKTTNITVQASEALRINPEVKVTTQDGSTEALVPSSIDSESFTYHYTYTVKGTGYDGTANISVRGEDVGGFVGTGAATFVIDTTAPALTGIVPLEGAWVKGSNIVTVSGKVSDISVCSADVNGTAASIDTYNNTFTANLNMSDGPQAITITAIDELGNTSKVTRNIKVDNKIPVITVTSPVPGSSFVDTRIPVSGRVSDENGIKSFSINGSAVTPDINGDFNTTITIPEGSGEILFTAVDNAGYVQTVKIPVNIDKTAPAVTFVTPADKAVVSNAAQRIIVKAVDTFSEVSNVTINAVPAVFNSATGNWEADVTLVEGENTISVVASDALNNNNSANPASMKVYLDTVKPILTIACAQYAARGNYTISLSTNETLKADPTAKITKGSEEILLPAPQKINGKYVFTYAVPEGSNGPAKVSIEAADLADNLQTAEKNFTLDTAVPTIVLNQPVANYTQVDSITVSGTVDENYEIQSLLINEQRVEVNPADGSFTTTLSNLKLGSNTITVKAEDGAGNTGYASKQIIFDNNKPLLVVAKPDKAYYNNSNVALQGTVNDATTNVTLYSGFKGEELQEIAVTAGSFSESLSLSEGTHTLVLRAVDEAGNYQEIEKTLTVDTTMPSLSVTAPKTGDILGDANIVVSGNIIETNLSKVEVIVGGKTYIATVENGNFTSNISLADGAYTLTVKALDLAGNQVSQSIDITVDTTRPSFKVTTSAAYAKQGEAVAISVVSLNKDLNGMPIVTVRTGGGNGLPINVDMTSVDGSKRDFAGTVIVSGSWDGLAVVEVRGFDNLGHEGVNSSTSFFIDTSEPGVAITSPNTAFVNSTSINVTGTYSDTLPSSGIKEILVNGVAASFANGTYNANITVAEGKDKTIQVDILDNAGNSNSASTIINVDATKPLVTWNEPTANKVFNTGTVNVSGKITDDNIVNLVIAGKTIQVSPITGEFAESITLPNGVQNLTLTAKDSANNITTLNRTVTIDTVAPELTLTSPIEGQYYNTNTVNIAGSANDATTNMAVYLNDQPYAAGVKTVPITESRSYADGAHMLKLDAYDEAGNSVQVKRNFFVDTAAPEINITSPRDGETLGKLSFNVTATVSDASPLTEVKINNKAALFSNGSYIAAVTLVEGNNTITVIAKDKAGNTSTEAITVKVDTTYPSFTVTCVPDKTTTGDVAVTVTSTKDLDAGYPVVKVQPYGISESNAQALVLQQKAGENEWQGVYSVDAATPNGMAKVIVTGKDTNNPPHTATERINAFVIDTQKPVITFTTQKENDYIKSGTEIKGTITDATTSMAASTYAIDGEEKLPLTLSNGVFSIPADLAEGSHAVTLEASDAVGNTAAKTLNIIVDNTAPNLNVLEPQDIIYNKNQLTVRGNASDNFVSPELRLNGNLLTLAGDGSFTKNVTHGDGSYHYRFVATDLAGNSTSVERSFGVDTTPPIITASVIPPTTKVGEVLVNIHVNEALSESPAVSLKLPDNTMVNNITVTGSGQDFTASYIITGGTPNGAGQFTVIAKDAVGNTAQKTLNFVIDTVAPSFPAGSITPLNGAFVNRTDRNVSIRVTPFDGAVSSGIASVEVAVDGNPYVPAMLSGTYYKKDFVFAEDGTHTFNIKITDKAGNVGISEEHSFTVDATKPELSINSPAVNQIFSTSEVTVSGTAADAISAINSIAVSFAGKGTSIPVINGQFEEILNVSNDGTYTLYANISDQAGNTTSKSIANVKVDTKAPVINVLQPSEGSYAGSDKVLVKVSASDNVSGVKTLTIAGETVTPVNGYYTKELTFTDGQQTVIISAEDFAGHVQQKDINFTVDTVQPELELSEPVEGTYYNTRKVKVSGSVSDITSSSVKVSANGTQIFDGKGAFSGEYNFTSDGKKELIITAADKANKQITVTKTIYVDTVKPSCSITVNPSLAKAGPVTILVTPNEALKAIPVIKVDGTQDNISYEEFSGGSYRFTYQVAEGRGTKAASISAEATDLADNTATGTKGFNIDTDKPKVNSVTPANNTEDISITNAITVTLSEDMDASSINAASMKLVADGNQEGVAGTISYSAASKQAIFIPSASLAKGTKYNIVLDGFKDKAGNGLDLYTSSFTTLTSLEMVKNGTGTDPAVGTFAPAVSHMKFTIALSEPAYVTLKILNGSTVLRTITSSEMLAGDQQLIWDGKDDANNILTSGQYDYKITAKDGKGLNAVPLTGKVTVDNTKPTVSVVPAPDTKRVAVTAAVKATFSEEVKNVIDPGSFTLTLDGSTVQGVVSYWNGVALFTPQVSLQQGKTYTAKLSSAVTDLYGNPLTEKTWQFIVDDTTPPVLALTQPSGYIAAKGVIQLEATASDNVGVRLLNFEYSTDNGTTWKLIQSLGAAAGTWSYSWNTAAINGESILVRAVAKDEYNSSASSSQTIRLDNTLPEITNILTMPKYFSANGTNSCTIQYSLSEPSNVTVDIINKQTDARVITLLNGEAQDTGKNQVNWNGKDKSGNLSADGEYYCRIQAVDMVGNESMPGDPVFGQITVDTVSPKAKQTTIIQPQPGQSVTPLDAWPKVTFNEDIEKLSLENGNFILTTDPDNLSAVIDGTIHYDKATRTAYYQADSLYDISTTYYVYLTTGVKDLAGNALDKEISWSFETTPDKYAPVVKELTPKQFFGGTEKITLEATDDTGIGSINVDWSRDGVNWYKCGDAVRVSGSSVDGVWNIDWNTEGKYGLYTIRIKLDDNWGRSSTTKYVVKVLPNDSTTVPSTGGNASLLDDNVEMEVPRNTFEDTIKVRAHVLPQDLVKQPKSNYLFVSEVFDLTAVKESNGEVVSNQFAKGVTVSFKYNLNNLDYIDADSVMLHWFNESTEKWEKVDCTIDKQTQTVTAVLQHFSQYSVLAKGKRVYLPTPKVQIQPGDGLISKFTADGVTNAPYEIYLPNETEPAKYRIHTNYSKNTDACASCHRTHTAVGASLLQWYSVYETCMACHDGTVYTTYNVAEGVIPGSPMPAFGGMFGVGGEENLSQHNIRGSVSIASAPGGSVVGVNDPMNGELMSWSVDFGCEDCHSPHGQGGNARILHPDPNGAARRNWLGGQYINDDRVGGTQNLVQGQWTRVTPEEDGGSSVKYAVYPLRPYTGAKGKVTMARDKSQLPLTWIKGYPYTSFTKLTDKNYPNGIPKDKYTIDNSAGYTYVVFDKANYKPDDGTLKMSFVASLRVTMQVNKYLQEDENIKLINGMNYFCSACHQDYNTSRQQFFTDSKKATNYGEQEFSFSGAGAFVSGDYSKAYRHQVGMIWKEKESVTTVYNAKTVTIDKLRFEEDPWNRKLDSAGKPVQIVTCLTCHYAHGTSKELWQRALGSLSILPENQWFKDEELSELNGSSALKRLPNMATCEECHEKGQANEGYFYNVGALAFIEDAKTKDGLLSQESAVYVGQIQGKCGDVGCHAKQATGWTETTHSFAMLKGTADINAKAKLEWHSGPQLDGYSIEDVVYVLGGKDKQAYVVRNQGLKVVSRQWLVADEKWELNSEADFNTGCVGCHTTGYNINTAKYTEIGVSCEACHGPASNHVKYPSTKNITMPANLSKAKQTELCGQCHIRGVYRADTKYRFPIGFVPGQDASLLRDFAAISYDVGTYRSLVDDQTYATIADKVYMYSDNTSKGYHQEYIDFIQSKHYATQQIACSTCHNTHGVNKRGYELNVEDLAICATCHESINTQTDDWIDYLEQYMPLKVEMIKKAAPPYDKRSHTFKK